MGWTSSLVAVALLLCTTPAVARPLTRAALALTRDDLPAPFDLRVNGMKLQGVNQSPKAKDPLVQLLDVAVPVVSFSWRMPSISSPEMVDITGLRATLSQATVDGQVGANVWDSGNIATVLPRVEYTGPRLAAQSTYILSVSYTANTTTTALLASPVASAFVHTSPSPSQWEDTNSVWVGSQNLGANVLRSECTINGKDIVGARLHASGLGWAVLHFNSHIVSDLDYLGVGWSQYAKRCFYVTYNVTSLIANGTNIIGAELGNGWRDQSAFPWHATPPTENATPYTPRALRYMLDIQDSTGVWHTACVSDTNTRGIAGWVTSDSVYNGQTTNAQLFQQGWDTATFANATTWPQMEDLSTESWAQTTMLTPSYIPPVRVQKELTPKVLASARDTDGTYFFLLEFSENHAGVLSVVLPQAPKNHAVVFRHAELLMHPPYGNFDPKNKSMLLYFDNLRSAQATDTFIFSGASGEAGSTWIPRFTYHGFRYALILGWPVQTAPTVTMLHFRSNVEVASSISTSSSFLNHMDAMVRGSQASNLMTVPTDCPQRDERLGWMGDAGLSADSMSQNYDMETMHLNFLDLISDDQGDDGSLPDVVPFMRYGGRPADPSWSAALVQIIWAHYDQYQNLLPMRLHSQNIERYLDNIAEQASKGLVNMPNWGPYGDWVPAIGSQKPGTTWTSAFNWLTNLRQAAALSAATSNSTAQQMYSQQADAVEKQINQAFLHWDSAGHGVVENGGQTSTALALALDLFRNNATLDAQVASDLATRCSPSGADKGFIGVGIIGAKQLFGALIAKGHADAAWQVFNGTMQQPSYGYMFTNQYEPATTNLWELWNADTQGPGMNSRNHHMFSSVGTFVHMVAGIGRAQPSAPPTTEKFASSRIPVLELRVGGCCNALLWANTTTTTPWGKVKFVWQVPRSTVGLVNLVNEEWGVAPFGTDVALPQFIAELPVGQRATVRVPVGDSRGLLACASAPTQEPYTQLPHPTLDSNTNELVFELRGGTYILCP